MTTATTNDLPKTAGEVDASSPKPKRFRKKAGKVDAGSPKPKRSRKKLILVAALVILLGVGGYVGKGMLLGGGSPKAVPDPKTVAGKVLTLTPSTMNLADGHYLKLTLALQLSEAGTPAAEAVDAAGAPIPALDGVKALVASIDVLGKHTYAQLLAPGGRASAQKELLVEIQKRYPGDVLEVYFAEFLMQ
jgi:flagellar FliL protein